MYIILLSGCGSSSKDSMSDTNTQTITGSFILPTTASSTTLSVMSSTVSRFSIKLKNPFQINNITNEIEEVITGDFNSNNNGKFTLTLSKDIDLTHKVIVGTKTDGSQIIQLKYYIMDTPSTDLTINAHSTAESTLIETTLYSHIRPLFHVLNSNKRKEINILIKNELYKKKTDIQSYYRHHSFTLTDISTPSGQNYKDKLDAVYKQLTTDKGLNSELIKSSITTPIKSKSYRGQLNIDKTTPIGTCTNNSGELFNAFKLNYKTRSIVSNADLINASAALIVPNQFISTTPSSQKRPLLIYQEGTETVRTNRTSNIAYFEASFKNTSCKLLDNNMILLIPDYLGFGDDTTQMHPYMHGDTLASASIDALRAAHSFLIKKETNINIDTNIFITGFSEGGYATMVTHREIQNNHQNEFSVRASFPIAGPYDVSGTMFNLSIADTHYSGIFYIPYVILAYKNIYPAISDTLPDVFIDGLSTISDQYKHMNQTMFFITGFINTQIDPDFSPSKLFKPEYFNKIKDDKNHIIRQKLAENDAYKWNPTTPLTIYSCTNDEMVPHNNATTAYNYMKNYSSTVSIAENSIAANHGECFAHSFPQIIIRIKEILIAN